MKKNIKKFLFALMLMLVFTGCEEIIGSMTGGLVIQEPDDGEVTANTFVQISVKAYKGEITRITCEGNTEYVDCTDGSDYAYFSVSLSEGSNYIELTGYTAEGYEEDSDSVSVIRDTTPPTVIISNPPNGGTKTSLPIVISGTVTDANGVSSLKYKGDNGLYGNIDINGSSWSLTLYALKDKTEYHLEFIAEDVVGGQSTRTLSFTYDTDSP